MILESRKLAPLFLALCLIQSTHAALIAGVDFENGSGGFSRTPDDYDLTDGITTSSGTGSGVFEGWTLAANGNLRNDTGANNAAAFEGNFPARLQDAGASWSITIPNNVTFNLDRVSFAVRGATGSTGRDIDFRTSLDAGLLYDNDNLPARTPAPDTSDWIPVDLFLTDPIYDGLTDTTIDFIWSSPNGADIDGILVYGTIVPAAAIPEPTSTALLGLGGFLLVGNRRRRG